MSLRDLQPRTRRRLRLHGGLLTGWCLGLGLLTSWWLLHHAGVVSPVFRYTMTAIAIYAFGLVLGVRWWLRHVAARMRSEAGVREPALTKEPAVADATRRRAANKQASGTHVFDNIGGLVTLDEGARLLLIPMLLLALVLAVALGFLSWSGSPTALGVNGLAGLLAEVAVQFAIGTVLARRAVQPHDAGDAFMSVVGKTWVAGLLLVAFSALCGEWLQSMQAVSITDLFR